MDAWGEWRFINRQEAIVVSGDRATEFRKDEAREGRLRELNSLLAKLEDEVTQRFTDPQLPVVFVIGAPRCGSTLLADVLSRTGAFTYVSNFVARFWLAPYIGMLISHALEIGDDIERPFSSEYGVTEGWSGPHEFGYFWSRWFGNAETHKLDEADLAKIDRTTMARELAALEHVVGKPLFFKNLLCGPQMSFLADILREAVFVLCRRDPLYNAQSLLIGREKVYGSRAAWLSLKPREYKALIDLPPHDQVAAQLHYTIEDIERSAATLAKGRFLEVRYEDLCCQPRTQVGRIREALLALGTSADWRLELVPERFELRNVQRLDDEDFQKLRESIGRFSGVHSDGEWTA